MLDPDKYRTVTHAVEADDTHYIVVMERTPENDQLSDEEIVKRLQVWKHDQHLHAIDDE